MGCDASFRPLSNFEQIHGPGWERVCSSQQGDGRDLAAGLCHVWTGLDGQAPAAAVGVCTNHPNKKFPSRSVVLNAYLA